MSTAYAKAGRKEETDEQLLAKFKRWFKHVCDTESRQRIREIEDLKFQVGELQWDPAAIKERRGDGQTSGRPTISINLLQQPMQLIQNQAEAADLGINIHPVSATSSKEDAEIGQGIIRRIERDADAEQVRLWAFDRAKQCGRGWYRISTRWDEDGGHPFDQRIVPEIILNQENVYMDPSATKPDYSDAKWGFFVSWMTLDAFKDEFPDAQTSNDMSFADMQIDSPGWVKSETDNDAVLVAEVWHRKVTTHTVCLMADGSIVPKEVAKGQIRAERSMEDVELCWYKITGFEILDREICDGKLIPLVFVPGRQLQSFDGERRWEGMVRPARHGQQMANMAASSFLERMGAEPKNPYVGYEGQFTDPGWKVANVRNLVFLQVPATPNGIGGVLPLPQRSQLDSTGMSLSLQAFQMAQGIVQSATAIFDPSLGQEGKSQESGKKVIALQQQADAGTGNYLTCLRNAIKREAEIELDLMPHVYGRPGRVMTIIGAEDEESKVMLGAPYSVGADGNPQRMMGQDGRPMPMGGQAQQGVKQYDLSKIKGSVSVSVGKSYQTQLQQGQAELGELLQGLPPELQILLLPLYMQYRDSPGSKEAADLMKAFRDSKFPGLAKKEGQDPTPEQLRAELQGMTQKMQEMGQQLQAAGQQIATDEAKQKASVQIAAAKAQTEVQIAQMNNAAKVLIARINSANDAENTQAEIKEELLSTGLQIQHEVRENNKERAHEVGMAAAAGKTMTRVSDRGQEQGREDEQEQSGGRSREPEPKEPSE